MKISKRQINYFKKIQIETKKWKEFYSKIYHEKKKIAWNLVEKFNNLLLKQNQIFSQNPNLYQYFY